MPTRWPPSLGIRLVRVGIIQSPSRKVSRSSLGCVRPPERPRLPRCERGCRHRGRSDPFPPGSPRTREPPGDFRAVLRPSRQRAEAAGLCSVRDPRRFRAPRLLPDEGGFRSRVVRYVILPARGGGLHPPSPRGSPPGLANSSSARQGACISDRTPAHSEQALRGHLVLGEKWITFSSVRRWISGPR
jgi:hypothetical protein